MIPIISISRVKTEIFMGYEKITIELFFQIDCIHFCFMNSYISLGYLTDTWFCTSTAVQNTTDFSKVLRLYEPAERWTHFLKIVIEIIPRNLSLKCFLRNKSS